MIVEFINEIKGQVSILKSYYEDLKRSEYFGILNQKENESYFFGLGDSYAASIAVSELTGCVYGEPYEWQYKNYLSEKILSLYLYLEKQMRI